MSTSKLFQPYKIGSTELKHRVVMAPLTRFRGNADHSHSELAIEYYSQRASVPGTLIITEATFISPAAGGYPHVPGIYTPEQIASWKKITDAVHAKGSFIYLQLWALGRAADAKTLNGEGYDVVSSSDVAFEGGAKPRALTIEEIKEFQKAYVKAAANAVKEAGFDGVELHGANGYLVDQFTQNTSNKRTDEYGGPIENRARFALETLDLIVKEVGAERTGIRLSPFSPFQGMKEDDPVPTFSYLITQIKERFPDLAYIHVVESRVAGNADVETGEKIDFALDIWGDKPFIIAGGYKADSGKAVADAKNVAVAYGRLFISNPDLPARIREGVELNPYNRDTFYLYGPDKSEGYTDYPFAEELKGKL